MGFEPGSFTALADDHEGELAAAGRNERPFEPVEQANVLLGAQSADEAERERRVAPRSPAGREEGGVNAPSHDSGGPSCSLREQARQLLVRCQHQVGGSVEPEQSFQRGALQGFGGQATDFLGQTGEQLRKSQSCELVHVGVPGGDPGNAEPPGRDGPESAAVAGRGVMHEIGPKRRQLSVDTSVVAHEQRIELEPHVKRD